MDKLTKQNALDDYQTALRILRATAQAVSDADDAIAAAIKWRDTTLEQRRAAGAGLNAALSDLDAALVGPFPTYCQTCGRAPCAYADTFPTMKDRVVEVHNGA